MEVKTLQLEECKMSFNDEEWKVEGYASAFDSVDKVGDTILPGAFKNTIESGRNVKMYYEHSRIMKPGKWSTFVEDEYGLKTVGFLTRGHSLAKDVRAELRHGTLEGLSIGFVIPEGGAEQKGDVRVIKEIDLHEVSFVGSPAEPKAVITAWKSELASLNSLRDCEAFLRESGMYSRAMATAFISQLKSVLSDSVLADEEEKRESERRIKEMKARIARQRLKTQDIIRGYNHD